MTTTMAISLARDAALITLLLAAPMLGFGLIVGLAISILQAVTQVNEMTLTFIPKIIAVIVALAIFLPWMTQIIINFTIQLFSMMPTLSP